MQDYSVTQEDMQMRLQDTLLLRSINRRHLLQFVGMGIALAGSTLLSGCGVTPTRTAKKSSGRSTGSVEHPQVRVLRPLKISPEVRESVVMHAMTALDAPYRYGGTTLSGGFDCSGLVYYAFSISTKLALPRTAVQWAQASLPLQDDDTLHSGDLVFFNTLGDSFSHMGIHVGKRQFIHAPSTGKRVRIDSLDNTYYVRHFNGARTVFAG